MEASRVLIMSVISADHLLPMVLALAPAAELTPRADAHLACSKQPP